MQISPLKKPATLGTHRTNGTLFSRRPQNALLRTATNPFWIAFHKNKSGTKSFFESLATKNNKTRYKRPLRWRCRLATSNSEVSWHSGNNHSPANEREQKHKAQNSTSMQMTRKLSLKLMLRVPRVAGLFKKPATLGTRSINCGLFSRRAHNALKRTATNLLFATEKTRKQRRISF